MGGTIRIEDMAAGSVNGNPGPDHLCLVLLLLILMLFFLFCFHLCRVI
jgi:hypothetical protein